MLNSDRQGARRPRYAHRDPAPQSLAYRVVAISTEKIRGAILIPATGAAGAGGGARRERRVTEARAQVGAAGGGRDAAGAGGLRVHDPGHPQHGPLRVQPLQAAHHHRLRVAAARASG